MKATYKQIEVLNSLAKQGKLKMDPEDIERVSKEEASQLISVAWKQSEVRKGNGVQENRVVPVITEEGIKPEIAVQRQIDFNPARLGQAANLAINGRGIDYFLTNKKEFVKRTVAIYHLIAEAEGAVKSSQAL